MWRYYPTVGVTPENVMSFKIFSHKLTARNQKKHCTRLCLKLFKVSTTSVTLPEKHVKHASESKNLRGSGLPQLPLIIYIHNLRVRIGCIEILCVSIHIQELLLLSMISHVLVIISHLPNRYCLFSTTARCVPWIYDYIYIYLPNYSDVTLTPSSSVRSAIVHLDVCVDDVSMFVMGVESGGGGGRRRGDAFPAVEKSAGDVPPEITIFHYIFFS